MTDEPHDRDILSWSEHQAELLRRLARGEGVNGVDWAFVIEEIEDVGLSELHSVQSYLTLMLVHLLKVHGWPESAASNHWRGEITAFQQNARRRFAPSMRQRIDLDSLYSDAMEQLDGEAYGEAAPRQWPRACPFSLDQLLSERRAVLEDWLNAAA